MSRPSPGGLNTASKEDGGHSLLLGADQTTFPAYCWVNLTWLTEKSLATYEESGALLRFYDYEEGLHGYTYLEDVHEL